jgi:hypothetical protein
VFDSSELPIVTIYAMYIPIFITWMKKATDENTVRRYVLPGLAILGSAFMVLACLIGHGVANFWYLIVFAFVMLIVASPFCSDVIFTFLGSTGMIATTNKAINRNSFFIITTNK